MRHSIISAQHGKHTLLHPDDFRWAQLPFKNRLDYLTREHELVRLTCQGLSSLRGMPKVIETLAKFETDPEKLKREEERVKAAYRDAAFVQKEAELGFPTVYAHGAVAMWVSLEALVGDILMSMIDNRSDLANQKPYADIKLTLSEFRRAQKAELSYLIFREIERETKAMYSSGITRFEAVLGTVGLSGKVNARVRRNIFELHNVRNLILHRGGIVDHRFKESCPWRRDKIGQYVRIKHKDYLRYYDSSMWYVLELINRTRLLCRMKRYRQRKPKSMTSLSPAT